MSFRICSVVHPRNDREERSEGVVPVVAVDPSDFDFDLDGTGDGYFLVDLGGVIKSSAATRLSELVLVRSLTSEAGPGCGTVPTSFFGA